MILWGVDDKMGQIKFIRKYNRDTNPLTFIVQHFNAKTNKKENRKAQIRTR